MRLTILKNTTTHSLTPHSRCTRQPKSAKQSSMHKVYLMCKGSEFNSETAMLTSLRNAHQTGEPTLLQCRTLHPARAGPAQEPVACTWR